MTSPRDPYEQPQWPANAGPSPYDNQGYGDQYGQPEQPAYGQGQYQQDQYGQGYQQDAYQQDPYAQGYQQDPYAQDQYAQDRYQQGQYPQEQYAADPYAQGQTQSYDPGYTQQYAAPPASFAPTGPPPGPPSQSGNKLPWIIGGALIAILAVVATVLIISNKDDGSSAGSDPTDTTGTTTTESVDPSTAIAGDWLVTTEITQIKSGSLKDEKGNSVDVGDPGFAEPQEWSFSGSCDSDSPCIVEADLQNAKSTADFELQGDQWVGEVEFPFNCSSGAEGTAYASITIDYTDSTSDALTGEMITTTANNCGNLDITEKLTISRA